MADGIDCINCGLQETAHEHPEYAPDGMTPCGNYDDGCTPENVGPPQDQCRKYPHCPTRTFVETLRPSTYDPDTCSESGSTGDVTHEGPCMGECRRRRYVREMVKIRTTPLNTAVYLLTPWGYVDIGS